MLHAAGFLDSEGPHELISKYATAQDPSGIHFQNSTSFCNPSGILCEDAKQIFQGKSLKLAVFNFVRLLWKLTPTSPFCTIKSGFW